jgi:hypothetical protein
VKWALVAWRAFSFSRLLLMSPSTAADTETRSRLLERRTAATPAPGDVTYPKATDATRAAIPTVDAVDVLRSVPA